MYVFPVLDCEAWGTDALNFSWEGLDSFVFGPVALIPQVIQKMTTYRCRIIMIALGWPGILQVILKMTPLQVQIHHDGIRVVRDVLVLGPGRSVHKPPLRLPCGEQLRSYYSRCSKFP